jgi:hypothetical protein
MSTPLSLIAEGHFTSTGAARAVQLPKRPDYFEVFNSSTWGTAPTAVVKSWWYEGYGVGRASTLTEGGASALTATAIAAGGAGFTFVDLSSQAPGALIATGTAVTNANPAVVADATSPAIGSIVRMLNTTGMLQIAGLDFTVTAVNPGVSFTLGYLNAGGFAAPATNADYRVIPAKYYSPYRRWITGITAANPAVITVSVAHNYLVGDKIVVHNPDANFGMPEIDGLSATITAVTASTITTDIDSSAFTAFAFPTSAVAAAGVSFPHVTNVGEVATKLTSSLTNDAFYAMYLDTGVVGANTNVMYWKAYTRDYTS